MKIQFNTDNAAFEDNEAEEIIRILNEISERVAIGMLSGAARDFNGNVVGTWEI